MVCVVLFDLGGVVLDSPIKALLDVQKNGNKGFDVDLNRLLGHSEAWKQLERGEITLTSFYCALEVEIRKRNGKGTENSNVPSPEQIISLISNSLNFRSSMIDVIHILKRKGYIVAALTNNWKQEGEQESSLHNSGLYCLFDHVFESSKLGMRKPEERIYHFVLQSLKVPPQDILFLDDIGSNLKAARKMGFQTIKVSLLDIQGFQAIKEVESILETSLEGILFSLEKAKSFLVSWENTWQSNEMETLMNLFSADVFYRDPLCPGGILGRNAVRKHLERALWHFRSYLFIERNDIRVFSGGFSLQRIDTSHQAPNSSFDFQETFIFDAQHEKVSRYEVELSISSKI